MGLITDFVRLEYRFRHLRGERLKAFQDRETGRLLAFARLHSPWYAEVLGSGGDLPDFGSLPVMDKALFMANFDRINTRGMKLENLMDFALDMEQKKEFLRWYRHSEGPLGRLEEYSVGLSSGTSGNKGLTVTPKSLARRLPAVFAARGGLPLGLLPFKVVFLLRVDNQAFRQINNRLITLRYVHTMTDPQEVVRICNDLGATVLMGPPSVLRLLAPFASGLKTPVRLLVSVAEVLHPADRLRLQKDFACPVHQIYQTTEGPIASSCTCGSLHINEDLMLVELLDEDGQPLVRAGQRSSSMLVTNLYNDVHPLIRYRMGDQVILGPPCACGSGFRVIEEVVGRDDDVLWLQDASGRFQPVFPDLFSRWIITQSDAILDFQVVQQRTDTLLVRLRLDRSALAGPQKPDMLRGPVPASGQDRVASLLRDLDLRIRRELSAWNCGSVDRLVLDIRAEDPPLPEAGAKYKRFVRTLDPPAGSTL